jgi:WD40 repeat protein
VPNPEKLKLVKDHSFKAICFSAARVGDSSRLFVGTSDFKVYEVDLAAQKVEPKELYTHGSYVTGVALVGKTLVSGSYDGKLTWYDTDAKKVVKTHDAHAKWIRGVFASRDGKLVASVADDMVCRVWEATGKQVQELQKASDRMPPIEWSRCTWSQVYMIGASTSATGLPLATSHTFALPTLSPVATYLLSAENAAA